MYLIVCRDCSVTIRPPVNCRRGPAAHCGLMPATSPIRVPSPTWHAIYRPQQKRQRMVRMRSLLLPAFLAFTAAVLLPNASIGQDAGFGRDADVHVREDSFACKETSELDRLLQRNQSGGFTSGVQLYEYLQSHNCIGL